MDTYAEIDGSLRADSSNTVNTYTLLDKTSPTMDGSHSHGSFYEQHIFGDQLPEDPKSPPSSPFTVPRLSVVHIDPVVQHKSSGSSPGRQLSFRSNTLRERLSNNTKSPNRDLNEETMNTSRSLGNIVSPTATRYGSLMRAQNISDTNANSLNGQQSGSNKLLNRSDKIEFYSLEEGLNWGSEIVDEEDEKSDNVSRKGRRHLTPTTMPHSQKLQKHFRSSSHNAQLNLFPTSPSKSQQEIKTENKNGVYKTVLYVVSNSPTDDDDPYQCSSWHTNHSHRSSRRDHHHRQHSNRKKGNPHSSQHSSSSKSASDAKLNTNLDGLQMTRINSRFSANEFTLPKRSFRNKHSSSNFIPFEPDEERPYYQTLPSPRQMALKMPLNGHHSLSHRNIDSIIQPTAVRLALTDFNQVVVDIKPRQLNEAEKQQHISQWIHVGTLGDSLNPETGNQSDSMPEDVYDALSFPHLPSLLDRSGEVESQITKRKNSTNNSSVYNDNSVQLLRSGDQMNHVTKQNECNQLDLVSEQASTPETVVTNSVKSNLIINVNGHNSASKKKQFHEGPIIDSPTVHSTELRFTTTSKQSSDLKPSTLDTTNTTSPTAETSTTKATSLTKTTQPHNEIVLSSHYESPTRITRTQSERGQRPKIAPKPTLKEQLAIIMEKQPMTTTGAEIRYLNSKMSSHIASPTFSSSPFTADNLQSTSKPASNHWDWSNDVNYLQNSRDTPIPNVRNLAAYFSDIIQRQRDQTSSIDSARSGDWSVFHSNGLNERDLPFDVPPFMLHRETSEQRERRLRAVKSLRNRSTYPTIDYTKNGSRSNFEKGHDRNPEFFNSYYNSRSPTPKPTIKSTASNPNRHEVTLSDAI